MLRLLVLFLLLTLANFLAACGERIADYGDVNPRILSVCSSDDVPDFNDYEAGPARKEAFIGFITPLVECQNQHVRNLRDNIQRLRMAGEPAWTEDDARWFTDLCSRYELEERCWEHQYENLNKRVDTIPAAQVVAQAAIESGWGTSKFAMDANNYFGIQCFMPDCGIKPKNQPEGDRRQVKIFDSPEASIRTFFITVNTHDRYTAYRAKRIQIARGERKQHIPELLETLQGYSEESDYSKKVQSIIRVNDALLP